jgi:hypothetical protein
MVGLELLALFVSVLYATDADNSLARSVSYGHLVIWGGAVLATVTINAIIVATDWVDRGY